MACHQCEPDEDGLAYIASQLNQKQRVLLRDIGAYMEDGFSFSEAFKHTVLKNTGNYEINFS